MYLVFILDRYSDDTICSNFDVIVNIDLFEFPRFKS
jgi:hypothetical protein